MNFIEVTKDWIKDFVIQLELCPFARFPFDKDRIRYIVYEGENLEALMGLSEKELILLQKTSTAEVETTLIIHPNLLNDFYEYNDFLGLLDNLLIALRLEGVIQIASFHPSYQFAGSEKGAVTNYTNRSPYPMLHLLREDSVSKAVLSFPNIEAIPDKNMAMLEKLGIQKVKDIFDGFKSTD